MTNRQRLFIAEYLKDFNATQAAIRAGYSRKTAYSIGQENLKKPEIALAVDAEITKRGMSKEEVLFGLAQIARGNYADLMDITPMGFTLQLMDGDEVKPQTKLIKKIKQKVTTFIAKKESDEDREVVETELELYSAFDAYVQLGRYHKLFTDKAEITGLDGEPLKTNDAGLDRAISSLADALREAVYKPDAEPESPVDAAKQTTVAGPAE